MKPTYLVISLISREQTKLLTFFLLNPPRPKALCKQLAKLHESTADVWPPDQTSALFRRVHARLLAAVEEELVRGKAMAHDSAASRWGAREIISLGERACNVIHVKNMFSHILDLLKFKKINKKVIKK